MKKMKIELFPVNAMRKVAAEFLAVFKKRVQSGKDANDKEFPPYTKEYAELKAKGMTGESGRRLPRYGGISITSKNVATPDFTLRGITLKSTRITNVEKNAFEFGWDGEPADIVAGNAGRDRDIMSDITENEKVWVTNRLGNIVQDQINKLKDVNVTIRI